jgi:hypothetical protein
MKIEEWESKPNFQFQEFLLSVPAGGFCLKNPLNKSAKKMNPISSGIPKYYL